MLILERVISLLSILLVSGGVAFFISGSLGLLRFPDIYCRLHAVTKADTLGLGLVALGLAFQAGSLTVAVSLILVWLLVVASGAVNCQLLARFSRHEESRSSSKPQTQARAEREPGDGA